MSEPTKKLPWGVSTLRLLDLLEQVGEPMSTLQIAQHFDISRDRIASVISRLLRPSKTFGRRLHIAKWISEVDGSRKYRRACYAIGDKPDAKKPKTTFDFNAWQRKRYAERKALSTGASVFHQGVRQAEWKAREIRL